jgi:hypothetical protein
MIKYPKTILKTQVLDIIRDVGSYITNGNLILTQSLTMVGFDRIATPILVSGFWPGSYTVPNELSGNNCCISIPTGNSLGIGTIANCPDAIKPGGWQAFMIDTYCSYFDSTSGATQGKRLIPTFNSYMLQSNSDGTQSMWSAGQYNTTVWPNSIRSFNNMIIGENSTTLFVLDQYHGRGLLAATSTTIGSFVVVGVNKTTTVGTLLTSLTTMSLSYRMNVAPKILIPRTLDNKCVIACYPTSGEQTTGTAGTVATVGGMLSYWILDLSTGTVAGSTATLLVSAAASVRTCLVPSSISDELSDTTKYKYYMPSGDVSLTTPTTIKRLYIPKTIGSQVNPLAGDMTSCTLSGLPTGITIPNANNAPTTNGISATSACLYLNQLSVNTKEYVVVLNMGYNNVSDLSVGLDTIVSNTGRTNGCDVSRQCLFVFQIDPTNSANLIYKSAINDGLGYGTTATMYNINKSSDNTLIVLSNSNAFVILYWNVTSESYTYSKLFPIPAGIGRISLDISNRVWIHEYNSDNIYIFSLNNSMNIVVGFAGSPTTLSYSGTPISQNVTTNAYDLAGTRYAKSVNLQLFGSAVFTTSGTNTITITTSATTDTVTAISITGSGSIQVIPTLVV